MFAEALAHSGFGESDVLTWGHWVASLGVSNPSKPAPILVVGTIIATPKPQPGSYRQAVPGANAEH
jgi:hypothetical protein